MRHIFTIFKNIDGKVNYFSPYLVRLEKPLNLFIQTAGLPELQRPARVSQFSCEQTGNYFCHVDKKKKVLNLWRIRSVRKMVSLIGNKLFVLGKTFLLNLKLAQYLFYELMILF